MSFRTRTEVYLIHEGFWFCFNILWFNLLNVFDRQVRNIKKDTKPKQRDCLKRPNVDLKRSDSIK